MRRVVALAFMSLLALQPTTAAACDPDWDWCGYEWYDPPVYDPPASSWTWWEPAYEPAPAYQPPPAYEPPAPVYEPPAPVYYYEPPAPVYEPPAPVYYYEPPAPVYEPPAYQPPPVYEPPPAYEPPVQDTPVAYSWAPEPAPPPPAPPAPAPAPPAPVAWSAPGSDVLDAGGPPVPAPTPAPVAPTRDELRDRYGLHEVTEVWAGNVVATSGLVTTYSTSAVALSAGTAAKLVASVATGEVSAYDGLLSTGRMSLTDGRPVKGDVYASYVWNGYDYVFDRYVFFQDDLEIARLAPPPVATPAPLATPPVIPLTSPPPVAVPAPAVAAPGPAPTTAPVFISPIFEGPFPTTPPSPLSAPTAPSAPRLVVAGIALGPQGDTLDKIEVLRGRRVSLWVRASVDGAPARVLGWRLAFGEVIALGPISGTGDEPLVATWRSITGSGAPFAVRIRATVELTAEGAREADATIEVVVRSPALVDP